MFLHHLSKLRQVKFRTLRPPVLVEGYLSVATVSNCRLLQIDLSHKQRSGKDRGQRIIPRQYSLGGFAIEKGVEIILTIVLSTASTTIDTLYSVQTTQRSGIYRFNSVKRQSKSHLTLFEKIWRRKHTQSSGSTIIHNYLHMPPASSNHSHHSRHTNTLESSPFSSSSLPQSSRRSNRSTLRSSPIPTDSDPDKMIEEYIQWHIDRTPAHRANLIEAKQKLLNEAMTLQTLHDSTASEIRDIGIELGIAKRLVKEVRQFAHLMREKKERELGELIDVDDQN